MNLKYVGEITDPIHKNIKFTLLEKELIDTFIFQRLRRIRQLAGAHLVYPGALHSRFEHSLGSMFLAGIAGQTCIAKIILLIKIYSKTSNCRFIARYWAWSIFTSF